MSDALPLPPRPILGQYKELAKEFQQACKSSDPTAVRDWAGHCAENIVRLQGLQITPEVRRQIASQAERIERGWRKLKKTRKGVAQCSLAGAQFFVARGHGFASWPQFAKHLEGLARANSPVSKFEAAVEAIISGNSAMLKKLLRADPPLVRARSTREHRSTLLHYVSANGVEDFRQKTPKNIVEITKILLEAGANVKAESEAYGGHSTTLGLAATSWHPEQAGVQIPLLELLIEHGATIDASDGGSGVNGCLHNGRGQAAEFLASRGAQLDLEGAAGVGRIDAVKSFFNDDGSLKPSATQKQMTDGFAWACEFGRTSVADFLLQKGMNVDAKLNRYGETGLHWAAIGGHAETVKLLLERKAPVDARDANFGGTPLGWALYAWGSSTEKAKPERRSYYEVVALLVAAGASAEQEWLDHPDRGTKLTDRVRRDPLMLAALGTQKSSRK